MLWFSWPVQGSIPQLQSEVKEPWPGMRFSQGVRYEPFVALALQRIVGGLRNRGRCVPVVFGALYPDITMPPSTRSTAPVMNEASSDARNATA